MSDDACYVLDPDGDVLLTLRNPNAPFAVWDKSEEYSIDEPNTLETGSYSIFDGLYSPASPEQWTEKDDEFWVAISTKMGMKSNEKKRKSKEREKQRTEEERVDMTTQERRLRSGSIRGTFATLPETVGNVQPTKDSLTMTEEVKFLLSSRHLSLASSYFKAQLNGPWREASARQPDGLYHIDASDWDVNALLLLMQIIHGKTKDIPDCIGLEDLAKFAVLIDYYKCHETTDLFSKMWVKAIKHKLPSELNRELVLWLLISVVFLRDSIFKAVTKTAVQKSNGPIPMLGLPIPQSVINAIDWRRQDAINSIFKVLKNLLESLRQGSAGCRFECSAFLLGIVMKNVCDSKPLNPTAKEPYLGYQLAAVEKCVQNFKLSCLPRSRCTDTPPNLTSRIITTAPAGCRL